MNHDFRRHVLGCPGRVRRVDHELAVGQIRRQVLLGTEAVYRVCGLSDGVIEVKVVRAPGLQPGQRFNVTRDAAQNMDLILDRV